MATCIFCSETGKSREHVLPLWITESLNEGGYTIELPGLLPPRWNKNIDVVTTDVCRDCNSGWMNDLEVSARPSLDPMIHGDQVLLSPRAQRFVAAWTYKTILTMERAHGASKIIQPDNYRAFERRKFPPGHAHIWLAASGDPERTSTFERFLLTGDDPRHPAHPPAYCATLGIKHLLMQVLVTVNGETLTPEDPDWSFVLTVWPGDGNPRIWPPEYAIHPRQHKSFVYRYDPDTP